MAFDRKSGGSLIFSLDPHPPPSQEKRRQCFFCLKNAAEGIEGKDIRDFGTLLRYLTGGDGEEVAEVPGMCDRCGESWQLLWRLHQELVGIQRRIEREVRKMRRVVRRLGKGEETEVRRIHDLIISQGDRPVQFPVSVPPEEGEGGGTEQHVEMEEVEQRTTILDVELDAEEGTASSKKQRFQVEFITCESYPDSPVPDYGIPIDEIVEVEQVVEVPTEVVLTEDTMEVEESNEEDSQGMPVVTSVIGSRGDDGVNIGGIPVDPSANYVMITTNVTDPITGAVSVQPILVSVAQLQTLQQSQSEPPSNILLTSPPLPSSSPPKKKTSKKEFLGAYSTPSEYVYYSEDLQPCDVCNARIPRGSKVASHLATHVGSDYVYYCAECQLGFISPFRLQKYHRSKPVRCRLDSTPVTGPPHLCALCQFATDDFKLFKKHLDQHERLDEGRPKSVQCPLCPLRFTHKQAVELHLSEKHVFTKPSGRQKCDLCGSFFDLCEIESHLWSHGVSDLLRCKLCMCIFSSVDAMIDHQSTVKRRGLHDISCHVCGSRFLKVKDLHVHYSENHQLGTKHSCDHCHLSFYTAKSFHNHRRKCSDSDIQEISATSSPQPVTSQFKKRLPHPTPPKKQCPDCLKYLSTSDILLRHRIKEHGHPPLPCSRPDCHDLFTSEVALKLHLASVHQGYTLISKPFSCPLCGESFAKKEKLKTHHFVKHCSTKPYTCETCGLTYRNKSTLQDHVNYKHLGVPKKKDKQCDVCFRLFSDSQVLKHHKLIHTSERPFPCSLCGQRFRQKTALRTHERAHARQGDAFKPKGEMERGKKKRGT